MTEAGRDLRLDFFRGLALFSIFLDHVPDNIVAQFTLQSVMFADAAEVFILISGYTAGMVYGRVMARQGFLIAGLRVGHRVWQLYVAHVFVFAIFMAAMAYTVDALNKSLYAEEFQAADFLSEPGVAVVKALTLQFQPAYMDILPLYIVLLAAFPFVLAGFRSWPWVVLTASLAVWLAVQIDPRVALPAYPGPDRSWYFNPFGWQALFFVGAWLGWRGTEGGVSWLGGRWLLRLAAGLALVVFVIRFSWTLHGFYSPIPALVSGKPLWPFLSKGDLGLLRFASVLAVALLVARLISPQAPFLTGRVARPFVICGRHSLHIFCLGILLAVLGHLVLNEFFGGVFMQLAVSAAGIGIMIAVAALMEWFAAAQAAGRTRTPEGAGGGRGMMSALLRRRRWTIALIAAAGLALSPAPRAAFGPDPACPTPEGFAAFETPLPKTAKALARGSEVVIAAVGGASSLGGAAGEPGLAWPSRLTATLAGRFPSARIKVVNLAAPRQTAREAADRLAREILPLKPTLVIWETGTVEAVRGAGVDDFRDTVQGGIDELRAAGIEVVLMNAQFSRDTDAVIRFAPYLGALRELADANGVPIFHRYGLMRYWSESGVLDLRAKDSEKRRRVAARLYDCLGRAMADFLVRP